MHSSRARLLWAGRGNGFTVPWSKRLFLVYTFCMGALWSLCSATENLANFSLFIEIHQVQAGKNEEFLKIRAKLAYFVIVSFRRLYSSVQIFMLYQAACSGIMEKRFPSRSFHIISPCQAQYALKHLKLFCTLRVPFALLTTVCAGPLSRAKRVIYWRCRLSAQWTIFYLGLHEGCFLKNLCRVFPEPFNNEQRKGNKAQTKSPRGALHFGLSPLLLLNIHFHVLLKPFGTTSCSVKLLVLPSSAGF